MTIETNSDAPVSLNDAELDLEAEYVVDSVPNQSLMVNTVGPEPTGDMLELKPGDVIMPTQINGGMMQLSVNSQPITISQADLGPVMVTKLV